MSTAGRVWNLGDGYTLGDGMLFGQLVYDPTFEPPSVPLLRATQSRVRKPTFSIFIEGVDDPTPNIKKATWYRWLHDDLGEPTHGRGRIVLLDRDNNLIQNGRCVIQPGAKLKIWTGFGDTRQPRFTGVVRDPKVSARDKTINLGIDDYGYLLKNKQTWGDWSDYTTPVALSTELLSRVHLGAAVFENQSGLPTTYTFGDTDLEQSRDYWSIMHGISLCTNCVYFFNVNGELEFRRRDGFNDVDICFDDSKIMLPGIIHRRMSRIINSKTVSHSPNVPTFTNLTLGDHVRWGQGQMAKTDPVSVDRYGEFASYEEEELIGTDWANVFAFVRDSIEWYKDPRHVYEMRVAARPQLELMDRIRVKSEKSNVEMYAVIIGIRETVSPANYWQTLTLLSEREWR